MKKYPVNDVRLAIIGDRQYQASYLWGELAELAEAVVKLDRAGIVEEFMDSAYAAQMLIHRATGWNFQMRLCRPVIGKFLRRIEVWRSVFEKEGVPFSVDYLSGGSNYRKVRKVVAAFAAAGHQITEERAAELFR